MRRLVLLRHGRTEGTERHLYYGASDLPLLPAGIDELKQRRARGVYPDPEGFCFVTSGMLRADQTLRAIYGDVPFFTAPRLREVDFGVFEMKSYEELNGTAAYEAWLAGDWFQNAPPGGESFADCQARILRELECILAGQDDSVIVCHGGTILVIMQALFPEEQKTGYEWQPKPGFGYEIDLQAHTYRAIAEG